MNISDIFQIIQFHCFEYNLCENCFVSRTLATFTCMTTILMILMFYYLFQYKVLNQIVRKYVKDRKDSMQDLIVFKKVLIYQWHHILSNILRQNCHLICLSLHLLRYCTNLAQKINKTIFVKYGYMGTK